MKEKERKSVKNPGMYRVDNRIELIVCARNSCLYITLCALCCLLIAIGITAILLALLYKQNSTSTTTTIRLASKSFYVNIHVIIYFRI